MTTPQSQGAQHQWDSVVSAALVGVSGRTVNAVGADPAIVEYLSGTTDSAQLVLETAALASTAARATVDVIGEAEPIESAPPDDRPPMTPTAAEIAIRMMDMGGEMNECARELLLRSGRAPTPTLLPVLLRQTRSATLRGDSTQLADIVGPRGRWLSGRVPELQAMLPSAESLENRDAAILSDDATWRLGTLDDRVRYLEALRRADPRRGVELLSAGWRGESGEDRERLILALAIGEAPDDEPFLEGALDDRRGAVRRHAARLLTGRPDSALVARLDAVLFGIVTVARHGPLEFEIDRTARIPESLARDGIVAGRARGAIRFDDALNQLIGAVPLSHWESRFGGTPAEIFAAVPDDPAVYRDAMVAAVAVQRNREWARAIAPSLSSTEHTGLIRELISDEQLLAAAADELDRIDAAGNLSMLAAVPRPWPTELSLRACGLLRAGGSAARSRTLLGFMRTALPVDDATADSPGRWIVELNRIREQAHAQLQAPIATTVEALQLRIALTRELS
ncbi:hypothetical protein HH308_15465 [Gordonia sp. TBRC 11910]|uniref:Uncharacterized protein n=1 Tax=Gordonia asplenii TaxID=2725283 RepID=A0A848L263_9ACTN|nr:DUF5691 domain-containing protein [Gordonia asplenii]NMO02611.1 hypothetical protein [Gordonia asplenii]